MPETSTPMPAERLCPTCDGFPVVAVTTTTRRRADGTLPTLPITCRDCRGTGHAPVRPARVLVAR